MSARRITYSAVLLLFIALFVLSSGRIVSADHSWGSFHWARTSNPFTLKLADNLSSTWDPYLSAASADWSLSNVLDTTVIQGTNVQRNCKAQNGRIEVCNYRYGRNGWLGIASIWASGNHITAGTVKLNDTYFSLSSYNTPAWKQFVMCQEIGHVFGLDHQDEAFNNGDLGTCMDYTNTPQNNLHPNAHDYELLESIYAHLDTTSTIQQSTATSPAKAEVDPNDRSTWGRELRTSSDKRASLYVKDLGNGQSVFTHVFWVDGGHDQDENHHGEEETTSVLRQDRGGLVR